MCVCAPVEVDVRISLEANSRMFEFLDRQAVIACRCTILPTPFLRSQLNINIGSDSCFSLSLLVTDRMLAESSSFETPEMKEFYLILTDRPVLSSSRSRHFYLQAISQTFRQNRFNSPSTLTSHRPPVCPFVYTTLFSSVLSTHQSRL